MKCPEFSFRALFLCYMGLDHFPVIRQKVFDCKDSALPDHHLGIHVAEVDLADEFTASSAGRQYGTIFTGRDHL